MAERLCMGCMSRIDDSLTVCPVCGYAVNTPPCEPYHLMPGTILGGKYIVGKAIGYGGFSVTYIGYDYSIEKKIAIKEYLPSEFATRSAGVSTVSVFSGDRQEQFNGGISKFVDEARRLAKFRGTPGVTDVYDVLEENNTAYIVMEYLDGETLKQYLAREGRIEPLKAVEMMLPIVRTLKTVHGQGLLHRDIAPDNIFITRNGDVKLIDFGAARQATSTDHSKSLSVIVKPGYAPPEQYRSRGDQGAWTDVYGCGATLYRMVTGQTPEDSMDRETQDTLKPPSRFAPDITDNIENAIMNAMSLEINDRTPDMARLEYELTTDDVVARNKVTSRRRDFGRWPAWLKVVMCAAILAVLTVGVLLATRVIKWNVNGTDTRSMTRVPNVINLTQSDAEKMIGDMNMNFKIMDKKESTDIPKGSVLSQNIKGGVEVQEGMTLEIVISGGVGQVVMPDVTGISGDSAVSELEKMGLHVKLDTVESEIAPDYVDSQNIKAGDTVDKGTEVVLNVSSGNPAYDNSKTTTVPNVARTSWDNARELARQRNIYIYKSESVRSKTFDKNIVMKQDLKAGEKTQEGLKLGVKVSLGYEKVTVPDVEYKAADEADTLLTSSGLKVSHSYEYSDTVAKDHVISQSVEAGKEVDPDTEIKLVISNGSENAKDEPASSSTESTTEYTTEATYTETTTEMSTASTTTEEPTTEDYTPEEDDTSEPEPTTAIVPSTVGFGEDEAIRMIKDAGLTVGSIQYRSCPDLYSGTVLEQSEIEYTEVDIGTSVSLIVCDNSKVTYYRFRDLDDASPDGWTEWSEWSDIYLEGHDDNESKEEYLCKSYY